MKISTEQDEHAARVFSRGWRWRINALVVIGIAAVIVALVARA